MGKLLAGIFTMLGSVNYAKGNVDSALSWFKRAHKNGKANPKTIISYAYLLLKSGDVHQPGEILNQLIETASNEEDKLLARSNLALVLWKKGNLDGAVEMLEEVCEHYKTTTVYGSLGYLLIVKGDLDKALQVNIEACEYNSSNPVILDNLGQTYFLRGEYEKSREIYEKLIPTNPTFPEAYYNYGILLVAVGEPVKGLEQLRKALNNKFSFLSTVNKKEVEEKIKEIAQNVEG